MLTCSPPRERSQFAPANAAGRAGRSDRLRPPPPMLEPDGMRRVIVRARLFRTGIGTEIRYVEVWDRLHEPHESWRALPDGELVGEAQRTNVGEVHSRMVRLWGVLGIRASNSMARRLRIAERAWRHAWPRHSFLMNCGR